MSHSVLISYQKGCQWYLLKIIVLYGALFVGSGLKVFSVPWAFHSEYCGYNSWAAGTNTISCTFASAQSGVVRHETSLAELSKPSNSDIVFDVISTLSPTPSSTATITIINLGAVTIKLGFFMLLIKNQPTTQYIEFVSMYLPFPSNVSDSLNSVRYYFVDANINSLTIMTTANLNNLKIVPFVTSFRLQLASGITNTLGNEHSYMFAFEYAIQSTSIIRMKLTVQPTISMSKFIGSMLLLNTQQIQAQKSAYLSNPTLTATDWLFKQYVIGNVASGKLNMADFQADFSAFGTPFNKKCFLGFEKIYYTKITQFQFRLGKNSYNNFYSMSQTLSTGTSIVPEIGVNFLCYGMGWQCSDSSAYYDQIDTNCYTSNDCPLPVPGPVNSWPHANICPWCEELICQTCTTTNRSQCLSCMPGSNSVLNLLTNTCQCLTGYYPLKSFLSPVTWNSAIQTTYACSLNCTHLYTGCELDQCDQTQCFQCLYDHMFVYPALGARYCLACNLIQAKCITCTVLYFCDTCQFGYYIVPIYTGSPASITSKKCQPCLPQCKYCQNTTNCDVCFDGYELANFNTACLCNPLLANLLNCITCTVNTTCIDCDPGFYVSLTTGLCEACSNISPQCNTCTTENACLVCNPTYGLESVPSLGKIVCAQCNKIVQNCDDCQNINTCFRCAAPFGLASPSQCIYCELLKAPGCIECTSSTAPCIKCNSSSFLLNGTCFFCPLYYNLCITCQANQILQTLECIQCQPGFYVGLNTTSTKNQCLPCPKAMRKCLECSNESFCTKCQYPNSLSLTDQCTECEYPFVNYDGVCMKLAGCINALEYSPGIMTCLACNETIHFIFESQTHNCICGHGYYEAIAPEPEQKCQPMCGDSILILPDEQCDDGNLFDFDGCNRNCKQEDFFNCDQGSPSRCVLERDITKFQFVYAQRIKAENKGILYFVIQPQENGMSSMNWPKLITLTFSSKSIPPYSLSFHYSTLTSMLEVSFPYYQTIENSFLSYELKLDPTMIKSTQTFFKANCQLSGSNFPLIVESSQLLEHSKYISLIAMVLSVLALVQFYLGSYLAKMIGLETIQIFQFACFARFMVFTKNTTLLNALDELAYSSSGYSRPEIFFGQQQVSQNLIVSSQFNKIDLQKYFLLNINLWLIPLILVVLAYLVISIRKSFEWKALIEGEDPGSKFKYVLTRRSVQYVYEQCIFPQVMMVGMLVYFNGLLCFAYRGSSDSDSNYQSATNSASIHQIYSLLETFSWALQNLSQYAVCAVFAFEVISSLKQFIKPSSSNMDLSLYEKFQLDQNSPHRPNYHSLYIFFYFIYYYILSLIMSLDVETGSFTFGLEISLALTFAYFVFISYWSPYSKIINIHNIFLKINHGIATAILVIYEVFNRSSSNTTPQTYIILAYVTLSLLFIVLAGGFVRIYFEHLYRKKLTIKINLGKNKPTIIEEQEPLKKISKKKKYQQLLKKNKFTLKNQLVDFKKTFYANLGQKNLVSKRVTKEQENVFMSKIKEEFQQKNQFYRDLWGNKIQETLISQMPKPLDWKTQANDPPEDIKAQLHEPITNIQKQLAPKSKSKLTEKQKETLYKLKRKLRNELIQIDMIE